MTRGSDATIDRSRYFTVDRNWRLTSVSPSALPRYGAALGRTFWESFPEAQLLTYRRHCERALSEGTSVEFVEFYNGELERYVAEPCGEELVVYYEPLLRLNSRTLRTLRESLQRIEQELQAHDRREAARRARESLRLVRGAPGR